MITTAATALAARRRQVAARGRSMTLRRQVGNNPATYRDVVLLGYPRAYTARELQGGLAQGDLEVATLADEIAAAAWPAPIRAGDLLVLDARTYAIRGAWPVKVGAVAIGWTLWLRGVG